MADRLEVLFQEWHHLGGKVLLDKVDRSMRPRPAEEVIAETTAHCRASGRLTWVVLDWLIEHIGEIDDEHLLDLARSGGNLSVLGVLCDAARARRPHPKFDTLIKACTPHDTLEPFFYRVAASRLASRLAVEGEVPLFRRWGYLSNECRYLADEMSPTRQQ